MTRFTRSLCFLLAFAFAVTTAFGQGKTFHVLAFYSTKAQIAQVEQDHLDFALQAISFFRAMAKRDHFDFETTTNWDDLNPKVLSKYQVVLWLDYLPPTPAQRTAFENYMEHGGAWMGFHITGYMDSRKSWPWYADFLGGLYSGNSWPPLPAKIDIDDPTHPVVKGLPSSYISPANEWYSWEPDPRNSPNIKVLMTLDPSNYPLGFKNTLTKGDIPVAWTSTKYKMIYSNMGHGSKIFDSPVQNRFFENALLWLGGRGRK